jgi:FkbM family methyltransferase
MKKLIFSLFVKITKAISGKGLGRIPGISSIYRLIYRIAAPREMVLDVQGNKMYIDGRDMGVASFLISKGVHEKYETKLFKDLIKPGMTVVDIGANIGYYTLIAAKLVGSKGKVYAFEPEPNNYRLLIKNIEENCYNNVIPIQKAVSNKPGKTKLFTSKTVFSSLSFSENNVPEKKEFVMVETITLDEFLENSNIDFIKMDTEGAEGLIVEGAEKVLKNNDLKIAMEFWPYGLKNLGTDPLKLLHKFQDYGFKIKLIDETNQCLKSIEIMKIIEMCGTKEGINLLLEK